MSLKDDTSHKSRRRTAAACLPLAVLAVVLGLTAVSSVRRSVDRWKHQYDDLTLREVSDHLGIGFPASARLISSHGNRGGDAEIYVLVEMARSDVDDFVKSIPREIQHREGDISRTDKLDIETTYKFQPPSAVPGWWRPQNAREYIAAAWNGSLGRMLIDLDDPRKASVYIYYWL